MVLNYFSSFPFSCFSFLNIFVSLQDFSCWLHSFGLHVRKRKTIACNHPETDSMFHDLAFLSAWVPFKASCTRDHSSGQREICKPQELLYCHNVSFQGVQRKKATEMPGLNLSLNFFLLNFLPIFIWLGNTGGFALIGGRIPIAYKV